MEVRLLNTVEDRMALKRVQSVCFLQCSDMDEARAALENDPTVFDTPGYGCFTDDGTMAAGMVSNPLQMRFDGRTVGLAGIGGVCTLPQYRRGGMIRQIFERLLRDERAKGTLFSGLYPFSHLFYRKFGYELSYAETRYEFKTEAFRRYANDLPVRMLLPEDDRTALLPVYEAFTKDLNLPVVRTEKRMAHRTQDNPYAKNDYTFVIDDGTGRPISYVCFNTEDHCVNVTDYACEDAAAMRAMLGFLYRYAGQIPKVGLFLPDHLDGAALVEESYDVKASRTFCYMMRSLDHERVLTLMNKPADAAFRIRVDDEFLPEAAGTWQVAGDRVVRTDDAPDLRVNVTAFTQLALGYVTLDTALVRGDAQLFGNGETLRRVFVKKPLYISDGY